MRKSYIILSIVFLTFTVNQAFSQAYLDSPLPGLTAEIFAANIISTSQKERDIAISPDGTEIYYTVLKSVFDGNIYYVKLENGKWSLPKIAPFSGAKKDLEPAFSPDGLKLFFASKRNSGNYDIWYVERVAGGEWSDPISVGSPVNTSVNEFYPSVANSGTLYFTANYSHGIGGEDIWSSRYVDGEYQTPVPVSGVSGSTDEFNAFVDPNEQYIYFGSFGRPDGLGGGDIYISRKQGVSWGTPENLGSQVNTSRLDYSPFVSPDRKYLFFTSERGNGSVQTSTNPFDLNAVIASILTPGSAGSDIYWIKR
jgi:Tol biopolymer transport system component